MQFFTKTIAFFAATFLLLGSIPSSFALAQPSSPETEYPDHVIGEITAPVQMEIFDDFQCPFCARFHETINSEVIQNEYINTGLLSITFKDFPLSFHQNAQAAAQAANAVNKISPEKYLDMINWAFSNQDKWSNLNDPFPTFSQQVQDLGLSSYSFEKYYYDEVNIDEINLDIDEGNSRGVSGTPTYYLNGKQYSGAYPLDQLIIHLKGALENIDTEYPEQAFYISDIVYDGYPREATIFWDILPNRQIDLLTLWYDVFDPVNGSFIEASEEIELDPYSGKYIFRAERNKRYRVVMTAYSPDNPTPYSDQISIFTEYASVFPIDSYECKDYVTPVCPDGWIYYLPSEDGCPGEPVCKISGGNIEEPIAGYEDEVRVRFVPQENPFSDNDINTLAGRAAAELFFRGVIGGFPDGEFKGDRPVNRAEAAKFLLLAKAIFVPTSVSKNSFLDVIETEWYGPFVIKAAELGIIFGYEDQTFRPANGVITAEFLAMLSRTFDLPTGLPFDYRDESRYPDEWFWDYAGIAQEYELFPNRLRYLHPGRELTRAEVAIAIYQYLKNR